TRIEQSLSKAEPAPTAIIAALGDAPPNTIDGQILLAGAYLVQGETSLAGGIAKSLWVDNFLTETQEAAVLDTLGALLDREAHWARAVHLMMHDRARASERLLPHLSAAQQSLVVARAAVARK